MPSNGRTQRTLKKTGVCPAGFEWKREGSGWRCAGGSHFIEDDELQQAANLSDMNTLERISKGERVSEEDIQDLNAALQGDLNALNKGLKASEVVEQVGASYAPRGCVLQSIQCLGGLSWDGDQEAPAMHLDTTTVGSQSTGVQILMKFEGDFDSFDPQELLANFESKSGADVSVAKIERGSIHAFINIFGFSFLNVGVAAPVGGTAFVPLLLLGAGVTTAMIAKHCLTTETSNVVAAAALGAGTGASIAGLIMLGAEAGVVAGPVGMGLGALVGGAIGLWAALTSTRS